MRKIQKPCTGRRTFVLSVGGLRIRLSNLQRQNQGCNSFKLKQPILATKTIDASKLALVVGHNNLTERNRLSRYEEIIRAGRFAALFGDWTQLFQSSEKRLWRSMFDDQALTLPTHDGMISR